MYVVQLGKTEVIIRDADLRIGETIVRHKGNVMDLAWRDKQTVKMVTTFPQNNMERVEVLSERPPRKSCKAKTSMHCGIQS